MPQTLIDEADAWAVANDTVRSDAIRRLVELGLKAKGKWSAKMLIDGSWRASGKWCNNLRAGDWNIVGKLPIAATAGASTG
jgi:hypothetical protein